MRICILSLWPITLQNYFYHFTAIRHSEFYHSRIERGEFRTQLRMGSCSFGTFLFWCEAFFAYLAGRVLPNVHVVALRYFQLALQCRYEGTFERRGLLSLTNVSLFEKKRRWLFLCYFFNSRLTRFGKASLFRSRLFADAPMGVLRHDRQLVWIHKTCLDVHARSWPIIACMHPSDHFCMMFARISEMPVIFYCSQGLSSSYYYPASPLANMAGHWDGHPFSQDSSGCQLCIYLSPFHYVSMTVYSSGLTSVELCSLS